MNIKFTLLFLVLFQAKEVILNNQPSQTLTKGNNKCSLQNILNTETKDDRTDSYLEEFLLNINDITEGIPRKKNINNKTEDISEEFTKPTLENFIKKYNFSQVHAGSSYKKYVTAAVVEMINSKNDVNKLRVEKEIENLESVKSEIIRDRDKRRLPRLSSQKLDLIAINTYLLSKGEELTSVLCNNNKLPFPSIDLIKTLKEEAENNQDKEPHCIQEKRYNIIDLILNTKSPDNAFIKSNIETKSLFILLMKIYVTNHFIIKERD
jgi:hypothetical protein